MNQWFTNERRVLDLYHENLYIATRNSADKKCGNPQVTQPEFFFETCSPYDSSFQCTGFFYNDNDQIRNARCPHCRFEQCQQCCRRVRSTHSKELFSNISLQWYPAHAERTCDQYAEWLYENDPNDPQVQLMNYLNTAGMVCPNEACGQVFE